MEIDEMTATYTKQYFVDQFSKCFDVAGVKELYRKLARQFHPDLHPELGLEPMQFLNDAYQTALQYFSGKSYQSYNTQTRSHEEKTYTYDKSYEEWVMEVIMWATSMPRWEVELCGSWIWVSTPGKDDPNAVRYLQFKKEGEEDTRKTFTNKQGQPLRFEWSKGQKRWYFDCRRWSNAAPKRRKASGWSMDEIRENHGSTRFATSY